MNFFDRMTDGLKLYEVLMMGLGSLMFLIMLVLLIIFVVQKRHLKQLMIYFAIPVLMLGWSSLQKIKIDGKGFELDKTLAQYEDNPTEENKEEVEDLVEDLKERDVEDPEVVKKIARAEYMIGQPKAALNTLEALPAGEKKDIAVTDLKTSINVTEALKSQLNVVQKNPADSTQIKRLNDLQKIAVNLDIKSEQADSSIRVANQKVTEYRIRNPRVLINQR